MELSRNRRGASLGRRRVLALGLGAGLVALTGCNIVAPLAYYLGPKRVDKAQFELTEGRLAVLIENKSSTETNPVFNQQLYDTISDILRDKKAKTQLVPYGELLDLQRKNPDFNKWSAQKVARELDAEQLLWIYLEDLTFRETPNSPILTPRVEARLRVIGAEAPAAHARLWPDDREGYPVSYSRQILEAAGPEAFDSAAEKLAKDAAYRVMYPFFDNDQEEKLPVAR